MLEQEWLFLLDSCSCLGEFFREGEKKNPQSHTKERISAEEELSTFLECCPGAPFSSAGSTPVLPPGLVAEQSPEGTSWQRSLILAAPGNHFGSPKEILGEPHPGSIKLESLGVG